MQYVVMSKNGIANTATATASILPKPLPHYDLVVALLLSDLAISYDLGMSFLF